MEFFAISTSVSLSPLFLYMGGGGDKDPKNTVVTSKNIHGRLNKKLNLLDVVTVNVTTETYLTLLIHFRIVSVQKNMAKHRDNFDS